MRVLSGTWNSWAKQAEQYYYTSRRPTKPQFYVIVALVVTTFLFVSLQFRSESGQHFKNGLPTDSKSLDSAIVLPPQSSNHPLVDLIATARRQFIGVASRQSRSLDEAVREYKRRHGIDPPPQFDKWYTFVRENNIPLVDEYDRISDDLRPFWGFSPTALRKSVYNALGSEDFLIGVFIRGGRLKSVEGGAADRGAEWRQDAIRSAIEPFAHHLPDMDLAFNMHDEPRVIIPHDQLSRMVERSLSLQRSHFTRRGTWSHRPTGLNDGHIEPNKITPFMDYAHRFTWPVATLSCPPNSSARAFTYDGNLGSDCQVPYTSTEIKFVANRTAFTDICLSPSFKDKHGFFNKPNSWSITHNPIPIFSPSKISTFNDILFPAPWYLGDKAIYNATQDLLWNEKHDSLYWRGSTTSGFSAGGTWHKQSRQRFVEAVEKPGQGLIYEKDDAGKWRTKEVERSAYNGLFDVHFSFVGQCAEEDCAAQNEYFDVRVPDPYEVNWQSKFLLDIDGNAFSGRFYTFLQSNSLTLKHALYREWHEDRIRPWAHYIPLGLDGVEHLEIMRFLTEEEQGRQLAMTMADESKKWADGSLRHVDMQAWMFRLLLEYARLVDDGREEIGYMPS